ncbi:MAG: 50S ribosomal protein L6 [Patescibacteria group bacterium]
MSRLAKKPIIIEPGVSVVQDAGVLSFKGPKGEKTIKILPHIEVEIGDKNLMVKSNKSVKQARANLGTMWSLIRNAIMGVSQQFSKILEIEGIGYRASLEGTTLVLTLGFVNPIRFDPPQGISIKVEKNQITVSGVDKEVVGQAAAQIRAFKKPEPYKGKGIHYKGEVIRRKAGKKATASA